MLLTVPLRARPDQEPASPTAPRARDIVAALLFDALVLGGVGRACSAWCSATRSRCWSFMRVPGYLSFAFPVGSQRVVTLAQRRGGGAALVCSRLVWACSRRCVVSSAGLGAGVSERIELRSAGCSRRLRSGWDASRSRRPSSSTRRSGPSSAAWPSSSRLLVLLPRLLDAIVVLFDRVQDRFGSASTRVAVVELRSPKTRVRSLRDRSDGGHRGVWQRRDPGSSGQPAARHRPGGPRSGRRRRPLDRSAWQLRIYSAQPRFSERRPRRWLGCLGCERSAPIGRDSSTSDSVVCGSSLPPLPPLSGFRTASWRRAISRGRPRRLGAGGWAILSQALAAQQHLSIGDSFTLPSPRPIVLRVAALSTNLSWPPGAVVLGSRDYIRAFASSAPDAYNVMVAHGVDPAAVRGELRRALGPRSALVIETGRDRERRLRVTSRQGSSRLTQIATLVLIATVISMSVAMATMIFQRRPRLARMKVQGYRRGVLWRALLVESAMLLGAGCSIGAAFGVYGQLLISHALASVTGFPVVFSIGAVIPLAVSLSSRGGRDYRRAAGLSRRRCARVRLAPPLDLLPLLGAPSRGGRRTFGAAASPRIRARLALSFYNQGISLFHETQHQPAATDACSSGRPRQGGRPRASMEHAGRLA